MFLVDFGNQRHPNYPDRDTDPRPPGPVTYEGPGFNEIPQPGPDDNSTQWRKKYNKKYYKDLYFGEGELADSLKSYYERQSSGRYSVEGMVTDFTTVPYNQARYGRSNGYPCATNVCSNTWNLVSDGMTQWVADQKAAGKTDAQIKRTVSQYDIRDRNDFDGDGNFDEPDGYIDRFQIIHAGGDQADGDPIYGEDAIWSHRWKAFQGTGQGPTPGGVPNPDGGTQIGNTGIWVADYTVQPENGGISVVAHEYGHDLGLPDHYDTAASGDNPVSWWTLMAQSRVSAAGDQGIGTRAADLGVWDKLQLGWLDYETVVAGQDRTIDLGPHEYNSARPRVSRWSCRTSRSRPRCRRRPRAPSSGTAVPATTTRPRCRAPTSPSRPAHHAVAEGCVEHRGGLRLRLLRGRVAGRQRHWMAAADDGDRPGHRG